MTKLLGGILYAVGILIMTGSGLCSLAVIVGGLTGGDLATTLPLIWVPFLVGGVPFAIGFGLFSWGRTLIRQAGASVDD